MANHSHIGASSMYRWSTCPGSVRLCKDLPPRPSSPYAEEGTLAHELAAHLLNNHVLGLDEPFKKDLPEKMQDSVEVYLDVVLDDFEAFEGGALLVEHRFDLSSVHPGLFGTADAVSFNPEEKLLRVYDYKHGAGISVDVENNSQLLYYGLGALLTSGFKATHVELVIVQPRCPHSDGIIRRWKFDAIELIDFSVDLAKAAQATELPDAPLVAGEHCRFCPAASTCPEIQSKALAAAKNEFRSDLSYDPQKLADCLNWLPALEGWIKNVREFAYQEAQHGRVPPGWKLVQKRPIRKWRYPELNIVNDLEDIIDDHESIWEKKLKTPAQLEKMMPKHKRKEFGDLWIQVSSGTTLVTIDDKRQCVMEGAKSDFTDSIEINEIE